MSKNVEFVETLFKNLLNQPVRNVELGHGSFLTMGFGKDFEYEIIIRKQKEIDVRPEWYFWVYVCFWKITMHGELLACSDDKREIIEKALEKIESKKLLHVNVLSVTYDMRLEFEGDVVLSLISNNSGEGHEQWMLFTPEGNVLTAGPRAQISYERADQTS